MFLGGIDANPGSFTGHDPKELKDMTPAERREATARDAVYTSEAAGERFYNGDRENWSVDFTGVVAGFLSTGAVDLTGREEEGMDMAIGMVENFLRYVLQHDVCPEYDADVRGALKVCTDAREEWPKVDRLQSLLPGPFNLAAAEVFPIAEGVIRARDDTLGDSGSYASLPSASAKTGKLDADKLFLSSVALLNEPGLFSQLCAMKNRVIAEFQCTLQVVQIVHPSEEVVRRFRSLTLDGSNPKLQAIGKVIFKPAAIEDDFDHPKVKHPASGEKQITLFFDEKILAQLKPGMKMALTIRQLDNGFRFVNNLVHIVPSFYTFLPQELMRYFKPPRPNERPGPSIHSPNGGEHGEEADEEGHDDDAEQEGQRQLMEEVDT
jgi:hypothetical protein